MLTDRPLLDGPKFERPIDRLKKGVAQRVHVMVEALGEDPIEAAAAKLAGTAREVPPKHRSDRSFLVAAYLTPDRVRQRSRFLLVRKSRPSSIVYFEIMRHPHGENIHA